MEVSCVTVASPSLKTRGSGYSCASGETSPPETAGGSRRRLTAKRRRLILPTYVNRICHDYTRGSGSSGRSVCRPAAPGRRADLVVVKAFDADFAIPAGAHDLR